MLKGGTTTFEVVLIWDLDNTEPYHMRKGSGGGGAQTGLPCLEGGGGGHNKFQTRDFPIEIRKSGGPVMLSIPFLWRFCVPGSIFSLVFNDPLHFGLGHHDCNL